MNNILKFDIARVNEYQPKKFGIKFDGRLIFTKENISAQETVSINFSDSPGQHVLEIFLFNTPTCESSIAIGNFKINHHDCVDRKLYSLFEGTIGTHGIIKGVSKISLKIDTPVIYWQQKNLIY